MGEPNDYYLFQLKIPLVSFSVPLQKTTVSQIESPHVDKHVVTQRNREAEGGVNTRNMEAGHIFQKGKLMWCFGFTSTVESLGVTCPQTFSPCAGS